MTIRLNQEQFRRLFNQRMQQAVATVLDQWLTEAVTKMRIPEARQDWQKQALVTTVSGVITGILVGHSWAVMDEFGKGSRMERDNPALDAYRRSEFWNPYRDAHDLAVMTRERPYTDIFGKRHGGKPRTFRLVNLEELALAGKMGAKSPRYLPRYPSRAVRDTLRKIITDGTIETIIRQAMLDFPWRRCFIIRPGGSRGGSP